MQELIPFASRGYFVLLGLLVIARGMDILSTRVATPNLILEGNPIARRLGWKWGIVLNSGLSAAFALWPLPAVVISTTSLLVAARNFQSAWLMRVMGEEAYRDWHVSRLQEARIGLLIICLAGQTVLTAAIGAALVSFSSQESIPWAIGVGTLAYAAAVAVYTGLALRRIRRNTPAPVPVPTRVPSEWPEPPLTVPASATSSFGVNEAQSLSHD
jgi:hypothetical protein